DNLDRIFVWKTNHGEAIEQQRSWDCENMKQGWQKPQDTLQFYRGIEGENRAALKIFRDLNQAKLANSEYQSVCSIGIQFGFCE
ncbi:MAG: hypothetical protein ACK53Y_26025, partial [bacterium]